MDKDDLKLAERKVAEQIAKINSVCKISCFVSENNNYFRFREVRSSSMIYALKLFIYKIERLAQIRTVPQDALEKIL